MIPTLDRTTLYIIGGFIAGYLESNGLLEKQQHNSNVETIQALIGGLIILFSGLWGMIHHTIIERQKLKAGITSERTQIQLQPVLEILRNLLGKLKSQDLKLWETSTTTPPPTTQ